MVFVLPSLTFIRLISMLISIAKFIEWIIVEPPYHEGPKDRQNVFAITTFRYIEGNPLYTR